MESTGSKWLKSIFHETDYDSDSPSAKRVKFSDVSSELQTKFPDKKFTSYDVSQCVHEAFPNTVSKACGKSRQKHLLGLERNSGSTSSELESSQSGLLRQIEQLKDQVRELKSSEQVLCRQADTIIQHKSCVTQGPSSLEAFNQLDFQSVITELQVQAPHLYALFMSLGDVKRNTEKDDVTTTEQTKAISSMCSLLNARSARVKGLQLLVSMMLVARATSRQAITVLSHTGVCMSYSSTWTYLLKLTEDAQYAQRVQNGHWMWVYDNLNLHQVVRHEREDKHSSMLNVTARLAVKISNFPHWNVDWNDNSPQCSRMSLDSSDFLPSTEDADALLKAAVQYTMEFLTEEFDSLKDLKSFVPKIHSPHPVTKPTVAPMAILFKDEKYKDKTIEIIQQLMEDAKLSGTPQVVIGDQLTCKNLRAMKAWTLSEHEHKYRLQWAHEVPGDFHFLWECLRVVFSIYWGTPSDIGSLCNMREFISRKLVTKNVKVFNVGDEFLIHTFRAHFMARICSVLKINLPTDNISHSLSLDWLEKKARVIVQETINPITSSDPVYLKHRSFLHLAFLYIDLRTAIRWEDGPHIVRHWKLWLPMFIGTGCKNYAAEAINLIAHLQADFPRHIAYIATHNRTVNTTGKPGHGKPIDQLMEHYVLVIKQTLRSSGANVTDKHITNVSMCASFLLEAAKKCDKMFSVTPHSTAHTIRNCNTDINKIREHLLEKGITTEDKQRTTPAFLDPTKSGLDTLCKGDWLQKHLASTGNLQDNLQGNLQNEQEHSEIDLEYELSDV